MFTEEEEELVEFTVTPELRNDGPFCGILNPSDKSSSPQESWNRSKTCIEIMRCVQYRKPLRHFCEIHNFIWSTWMKLGLVWHFLLTKTCICIRKCTGFIGMHHYMTTFLYFLHISVFHLLLTVTTEEVSKDGLIHFITLCQKSVCWNIDLHDMLSYFMLIYTLDL